ncbi:MAG: hypothetical protein QW350_02665 [Candidatus Aenigmatarchaeota archaeon]
MKGVNFMIEIAISILIISISMLFLYKIYNNETTTNKYKFETFYALKLLDEKNELRSYVLKNDENKIHSLLSNILGEKFNFYVVIFNKTTNTTIIPKMNSKNIAVVDYHISGDFGIYSPRIIKVFIWD